MVAIYLLSIIWKSDLSDKVKWEFFQVVPVSVLWNGYTTGILTKRLKNKLDGNYTKMLHGVLSKSKKQHSTKQ